VADRLPQIGRLVADGRAVVIPDAFRKEVAEEVFDSLSAASAWTVHTYFRAERPYFYYRQDAIDGANEPLPPAVRRYKETMGAARSLRMMTQFTDVDVGGGFGAVAAVHRPGDYSAPHNDDGGVRSMSAVWYLSRDWRPDWGGHFVWCPTGASVSPGYNTLVVFKITKASMHFVSPVAPHAAGYRFSLAGFFRRARPTKHGFPEVMSFGDLSVCAGSYGARQVERIEDGLLAL
jgi:Rps23 Pro-64 3,4-dihydroxylase Tpa1-like proline 4-hydroxylase